MAAAAPVGGEETMPGEVTPGALRDLLSGGSQFALIDVREAGEYNSSHVPGASLIPRRLLESQIGDAVSHAATPIVVCDDDGRRARLTAQTLERLGYSDVSHLAGGINRWVTEKLPTEWGVNVPSKDFGERVEVEKRRSRNHRRGPARAHGARRQAGGAGHADAGGVQPLLHTGRAQRAGRGAAAENRRHRSGERRRHDRDRQLRGTHSQHHRHAHAATHGHGNVFGLENGTSGWVLAGYELETGADRFALPDPSAEGQAEAEDYARRVASETACGSSTRTGCGRADGAASGRDGLSHRRSHAGGARSRTHTGLPVVPRRAVRAAVGRGRDRPQRAGGVRLRRHGARRGDGVVVPADGFGEVYVVEGGASAWTDTGHSLESGLASPRTLGLEEARARVRTVSAAELRDAGPHAVLSWTRARTSRRVTCRGRAGRRAGGWSSGLGTWCPLETSG